MYSFTLKIVCSNYSALTICFSKYRQLIQDKLSNIWFIYILDFMYKQQHYLCQVCSILFFFLCRFQFIFFNFIVFSLLFLHFYLLHEFYYSYNSSRHKEEYRNRFVYSETVARTFTYFSTISNSNMHCYIH